MPSDASLDAPVPQGRLRAKRIDPNLRDEVAPMLSAGSLSRTSVHVSKLLARVRKWKVKVVGPDLASVLWRRDRPTTCVQGESFFSQPHVTTVSVTLDATRMSGRDTLYVALYSPYLDLDFWCPPQAHA